MLLSEPIDLIDMLIVMRNQTLAKGMHIDP